MDDRLGARGEPREILPYWWDLLAPLRAQLLGPLRDACDQRRSARFRRRRLHAARQALHEFEGDMRVWFDGVDAMLRRRGIEDVDHVNPAQADAFLARISPSGRKALEKRKTIEAAVAFAHMAIERAEWELRDGD